MEEAVLAWSSPVKSLAVMDESSSEFQVHIADSSIMLESTAAEIQPTEEVQPFRRLSRSPLPASTRILPVEVEIDTKYQGRSLSELRNDDVPLPNPDLQLQSTAQFISQADHSTRLDLKRERGIRSSPEFEQLVWQRSLESHSVDTPDNTLISSLQNELEFAETKMVELEEENERMHSICQQYEMREEQANDTMNNMALDIEELRSAWEKADQREKSICLLLTLASQSENKRLRQIAEEMSHDLDLVVSRLDNAKKQAQRHEADFELFARKIKAQQNIINELEDEKESLKASLRVSLFHLQCRKYNTILQLSQPSF